MKFSIITVAYNAAETIESTMRSVLCQEHIDLEYIVLDGGSTDGTQEIIEKYQDRLAYYKSEPDNGLYDALNKALAQVTGDYVGLLHADDFYAHSRVLSRVSAAFRKYKTEAVYTDLCYVDRLKPNRIIRKWRSGRFKKSRFLHGWMPPHPALFLSKEVYEKHKGFNLELKSSADYEFMLRILYKEDVSAKYVPGVSVKMRTGGTSNRNFNNRLRANQEDRKAWDLNSLTPPPHTIFLKPIRKIPQYLTGRLDIAEPKKQKLYAFQP